MALSEMTSSTLGRVFQAKRVGVNCVILPPENREDYSSLPSYIIEGLEVHFLDQYRDIYDILSWKSVVRVFVARWTRSDTVTHVHVPGRTGVGFA